MSMTPTSTRLSKRLADGSASGKSFYSPCFRALDTYLKLGQLADRVALELDQVTTTGIKREVSVDDSLVIAIMDFPGDD